MFLDMLKEVKDGKRKERGWRENESQMQRTMKNLRTD